MKEALSFPDAEDAAETGARLACLAVRAPEARELVDELGVALRQSRVFIVAADWNSLAHRTIRRTEVVRKQVEDRHVEQRAGVRGREHFVRLVAVHYDDELVSSVAEALAQRD